MKKNISIILFGLMSFNIYAQTVEDQINQNNTSSRTEHQNNFKNYPLAYSKTKQKSFDEAKLECSARALAIYNKMANKDYDDYTFQFNNCMSQYIPFKQNDDCVAGQSITFGSGGTCQATLSATVFDGSNTGFLTNENNGFTGSANFKCNKGVLVPITETCNVAPSGDCDITAPQLFTMEIENKSSVGEWRTDAMNTCRFTIPAQKLNAGQTITVQPMAGVRVWGEYRTASTFIPEYTGQLTAKCENGNLTVESQNCATKIMNCRNNSRSVLDSIYHKKRWSPTEVRTTTIDGKTYKSVFKKAGEVAQNRLVGIYENNYALKDITNVSMLDTIEFRDGWEDFRYWYAESVYNSPVLFNIAARLTYNDSFTNNRNIRNGESVRMKLFSPFFKDSDTTAFRSNPSLVVSKRTAHVYPLSYVEPTNEDAVFQVLQYSGSDFIGLIENNKNLRGDIIDAEVLMSCKDGMLLVDDLKYETVNETKACTTHELYMSGYMNEGLSWTMSDNKSLAELCPLGDYCEAAKTYKERGSNDYQNPTYSYKQFFGFLPNSSFTDDQYRQMEFDKIKGLTCYINKPLEQYRLGHHISIPVGQKITFNSESSIYTGQAGFNCQSSTTAYGSSIVYNISRTVQGVKNNGYNVVIDNTDTCSFINPTDQFKKCYFVGTTNCPAKIMDEGEGMLCSDIDTLAIRCLDGVIKYGTIR